MMATKKRPAKKARLQFLDVRETSWNQGFPRGCRVFARPLKQTGRVDAVMKVDGTPWFRVVVDADPDERRYWFVATQLDRYYPPP